MVDGFHYTPPARVACTCLADFFVYFAAPTRVRLCKREEDLRRLSPALMNFGNFFLCAPPFLTFPRRFLFRRELSPIHRRSWEKTILATCARVTKNLAHREATVCWQFYVKSRMEVNQSAVALADSSRLSLSLYLSRPPLSLPTPRHLFRESY